ncbi:MAG: cupin domain-containing protein [Ornithinimicrobium sp.]
MLVPLCRALHTHIRTLLDMGQDEDVIIEPVATGRRGRTESLRTRLGADRDVIAAEWRLEPVDSPPVPRVHPGYDWFFVLSGAVELILGERTLHVYEGQEAECSTMTPHGVRSTSGRPRSSPSSTALATVLMSTTRIGSPRLSEFPSIDLRRIGRSDWRLVKATQTVLKLSHIHSGSWLGLSGTRQG